MTSSVALVVLDSVRTDYFQKYFDWLDGMRFTNAWSTGNYSIPAHGSLFGGRYPSELGVHAKSQALDCPEPVLAERFRSAGYRTRAYSANALVGPDLKFDRGFDEFNPRWDLSATFPHLFSWRDELDGTNGPFKYPRAAIACLLDRESQTLPSLRHALDVQSYDDEGAAEALSFLRDVAFGDREFLFMNLMEAHWPYWGDADFLSYAKNPIEKRAETVPGGDIDLSPHEEGYEEWVAYLSERYREIHALLVDEFDYVVTLADHGELFGEGGAKAHFYGLFEELTHVPLVIAGADVPVETRDDVVSLVDVHATISAMGDLQPADRGVDLLSESGSSPRLVEFHGFRADRLDSLRANGFDDDDIDPYDQYRTGIAMPDDYYGHESVDGFVERGTPNGDPRAAMTSLRESLDVRDVGSDNERTLSAATKDQLKRLGYRE
jgi:arylsulfatase A-like enzyme